MLKGIQKLMNKEKEGDVEMSAAELATELTTTKTTLEAQVAQFSELSTKYASLEASFAELTSQLESAQAALAAADTAKKQLEVDAHTAKMTARKERIVAFVGDEKAEALMAATESLDDVTFNLIVDAKATALATEASSPLFQETGVAAEANTPDVDPVQSLAKAFAEKFKTN